MKMVSLAAESLAAPTPDNWITPQEQFERLAFTSAEMERLRKKVTFEAKDDTPRADLIAGYAARFFMGQLEMPADVQERPVPPLTHLAAAGLIEARPLPPILTNWYTARARLGALPEKIPPLPEDIFEILNSDCPIYGDRTKPDGTRYKVIDTHFLQLLCQEDGNLDQFERNIVKSYGLQFHFWSPARVEYGRDPFEPTHWELTTREILPESGEKSCEEQAALVSSLANYELPSLKNISRTLVLHKAATDESLYPANIYTRVRDSKWNWRLLVGGFAPEGLSLKSRHHNNDLIGVAAVRKL